METPKVVLSTPATDPEAPRSRKSSSTHGVVTDRIRSSSMTSADGSLQKTDKRKPSMSNPYFHTSPRKLSTKYGPKLTNEMAEFQSPKVREMSQRKLQPTYITEPEDDKMFSPHVVKKIMDNSLEEALEGMEQYEAARCRALSVTVSEDIKQKVKWLNYDRYKLVCVVYFGSDCGQEMRVTSRCLWNEKYDNFASSSVRRGDFYAVALMYGVYRD